MDQSIFPTPLKNVGDRLYTLGHSRRSARMALLTTTPTDRLYPLESSPTFYQDGIVDHHPDR